MILLALELGLFGSVCVLLGYGLGKATGRTEAMMLACSKVIQIVLRLWGPAAAITLTEAVEEDAAGRPGVVN